MLYIKLMLYIDNCYTHLPKLGWVIPKPFLQASVGTKKEGGPCCWVLQPLYLVMLIWWPHKQFRLTKMNAQSPKGALL